MEISKFKKSIKEDYKENIFAFSDEQTFYSNPDIMVKLQLVEVEKKAGYATNQRRGRDVNTIRTPIEPADFFKPNSKGKKVRRVLLEGDAGMGKSKFCTTVFQSWADETLLQDFELLLYFPLREEKVATAETFTELLQFLYTYGDKVCESVANHLKENKFKDVLIIADGYDELQTTSSEKTSFIYKIISGKELHYASVMLTSRPSASAHLHKQNCIDRCVEIEGFSNDNITEYIEAEFEGDKKNASGLLNKVHTHAHISGICRIPLNCAIVCHLWRYFAENLPSTVTGLYTQIILNTIVCNIHDIDTLPDFSSLPHKLQERWLFLCELAYQAIESGQVGISHKLRESKPQEFDRILCFGLLQSTLVPSSVGRRKSFHFIHLTFQEYLAALYLVNQSPEKQLEICKSHATAIQFRMVWRFYFGICCGKSTKNEQCNIKKVAKCFIDETKSCEPLLLCHCSFEASSCSYITTQVAQSITQFYGQARTAHDCAAVVSVISNIRSRSNVIIYFTNCGLGDKEMMSLTNALAKKAGMLQVETLDVCGNKLTGESIRDLFCGRTKAALQALNSLDLSQNPLEETGSGMEALKDAGNDGILNNLKSLSLAETLTSQADKNAQSLAPFLQSISTHCHRLCSLNLSNNHLDATGAWVLGEALSHLTHNKDDFVLRLNETNLGEGGTQAFTRNLQEPCNFKRLELRDNNIHGIGASHLANAADFGMLNVQDLNLDGNPLGLGGVEALGRMLSSSKCQVKSLSIVKCHLTDSSDSDDLTIANVTKKLQQMPRSNTHTLFLNVNENEFSDDTTQLLVALMHLCQELKTLWCCECSLTDQGVEILSRNTLPSLEELSLHNNPSVSKDMEKKVKEAMFLQKMFFASLRVVRGHDWQSGDEDGGEGHVGTVVEVGEHSNGGRRVVVQWDCGNRGSYRCGVDGKFDLRVLDSIQMGRPFAARCDVCSQSPSDSIVGTRWKCANCDDYDLCTSCYMAGKTTKKGHSLKHEFYRFSDYDSREKVHLPARSGARRLEAKGVYCGAEVVRGLDWDQGDDNGITLGKRGTITSLEYADDADDNERRRKCLKLGVKWTLTDKGTVCKIGHTGKDDVMCVTPASGGYFYPDHLPMLAVLSILLIFWNLKKFDPLQDFLCAHPRIEQEVANTILRSQEYEDDDDTDDDVTASDDTDDDVIEDSASANTEIMCLTIQPSSVQIIHKTHVPNEQGSALINCTRQDYLNIEDLREVRTAIWDVRVKWYDLGVELRLDVPTLEAIKADNKHQSDNCFTTMLTKWLQRVDPQPSRTALIEALKSPPVDHPHLVQKLM